MAMNPDLFLFLIIALIPPLIFFMTRRTGRRKQEMDAESKVDAETSTIDAQDHTEADSVRARWQIHRYKAVFSTLQCGVALVDGRGVIKIANPQFFNILDIHSDFPNGTTMLGAGRFQRLLDLIDAVLDQGKPVEKSSIELQRVDGNPVVIQVDAIPLQSEQIRFPEVVLQFRDVTNQHLRVPAQHPNQQQTRFQNLIGRGEAMRQVFDLLHDLRDTDSSVLITGESGTGKELVAEALHRTSGRASGPFVKVNCAALSETLLESELFGHVRGAYTGAVSDRVGRFEAAQGGTLFLDEIAELSPRLQTKLLRVLQVGEFERVGETRTIHTDARIIAATNRNLMERMEQGLFRQDLYYRLNVINVQMPPLRERPDDIPDLADHFLQRFSAELNRPVQRIHEEAMQLLVRYEWPGNVRELENALNRAVIISDGEELLIRHLPREIWETVNASKPDAKSKSRGRKPIDEQRVRAALDQQNWVIARAARQLGISRNYLYQKIEEYGIKRPDTN